MNEHIAHTTRTALSAGDIKQAFVENLRCALGRAPEVATKHDLYLALALTIRDRLQDHSVQTVEHLDRRDARMGKFSSDRSIRDYCAQVWKTKLAARE